MVAVESVLPLAAALLLSPLLSGVINRVKARVAGRRGPPLLQSYFDLRKLVAKAAAYSTTTTWVFRAGPAVALSCAVAAALLVPLGPLSAALPFPGDLLLFVYLLALGRFFVQLAALDTGSSFEGMGASREAFFAALAEVPLVSGLLVLSVGSGGSLSLTTVLGGAGPGGAFVAGPPVILVVVALYLVFLAENARVPVDDPNTHLELTMVHEVMVLDHSGVDLAYITYAAGLRMWLMATVLVAVALPVGALPAPLGAAATVAGAFAVAAITGLVESITARVRLTRVPRLLVAAAGLAAVAAMLVLFE